ncbi:hypothetical protein DSM3645_03623 [Blastopirellula marina DSM 3645]|uniref:Uncharacterized protein n=1 Tax=Blastopirellula marina DSM 3645 TaxID=314230 RepID=A3ZW36_9BACT|nr:hypothetical protein DSM3645_03623 [Blastopirellula marina DSM 3645]
MNSLTTLCTRPVCRQTDSRRFLRQWSFLVHVLGRR